MERRTILAEVPVLCELVSAHHFPDISEKYREFRRIWHLAFDIDALLARHFKGLQLNSLRDATGNFRV